MVPKRLCMLLDKKGVVCVPMYELWDRNLGILLVTQSDLERFLKIVARYDCVLTFARWVNYWESGISY